MNTTFTDHQKLIIKNCEQRGFKTRKFSFAEFGDPNKFAYAVMGELNTALEDICATCLRDKKPLTDVHVSWENIKSFAPGDDYNPNGDIGFFWIVAHRNRETA